MKNLITTICFLGMFTIISGQEVLIDEHFDDNKLGWYTGSDSIHSAEVRDGVYALSYDEEMSYSYTLQLKKFDHVNDFSMEARMKQTEGSPRWGYGIVFGGSDPENYYAFTVSSEGYFKVYGFEDGKYKNYGNWRPSSTINIKGEDNVLRIEKRDGLFHYLINGEEVFDTAILPLKGNNIGFIMNKAMKAEVDYVRFTQEERKLESGGGDTKLYDSKHVLNEAFNTNDRDWFTGKNPSAFGDIRDGKYYISHKRNQNSYSFVNEVFVDQSRDYLIKARLRQLSGMDNTGYGIVFGMEDSNNYYAFNIASTGYFNIYGVTKSENFDIIPWEESKHVNGMEEWNDLIIRKDENTLHFFINDKHVASVENRKLFGNTYGFILNRMMHCEVDHMQIKGPDLPINVIENPIRGYEKKNLGESINTEAEDLGPVITADGQTLYFFRDDYDRNTQNPHNNDIWYAERDEEGEWEEAKNIGFPLNNGENNFVISVSPDKNSMLVANTYKEDGSPGKSGVSITYREGDSWTIPEELNIKNFYTHDKYVNYFLAPDNKTLVMALERKDAVGGTDLYVSFKEKGNQWTEPEHMGNMINTSGREYTPFIASDNKTLYFASDGFPGYGSHDIFVTRRTDDTWTHWTKPKNLGPEINSVDWDGYYSIPASGEHAYLVSYENSIGKADIFKIKLHESARPDPVLLVRGKVLNNITKDPIGTEIAITDMESGEEIAQASSDPETGRYEIVLPTGKEYGFYARKKGFYSVRENLDVKELYHYDEKNLDLLLAPIQTGQDIRMNNVFFERGTDVLKEKSYAELDELAMLMKHNPDIKIEISGHTDNIGDDQLNLELSEERVQRVEDYLISKGIRDDRISGKGYGGERPVADNRFETTRKLNRRVEFQIFK